MIRFALVAAAISTFLTIGSAAAHAQKSAPGAEGPTTVGGSLGVWMGPQSTARLSLFIDHYLDVVVARVELWTAPWKPRCFNSAASGCERRLITGLSFGGRLMDRGGDSHPYVGAGGGKMLTEDASQMYLELGLRRDVRDNFGIDLQIHGSALRGSGNSDPAIAANLGGWIVIR